MVTTTPQLRERIEEVSAATASGDHLVTIAVPADGTIGETLERVEEDHAEAEYIDAEHSTRPEREVLQQARRVLQRYDGTPENGLVAYVGHLEHEGEVVEYVFDDLPTPVTEAAYDRGNEFDVAPLDHSLENSEVYGLLVVERGRAALGLLRDGHVSTEETLESHVRGKTRAGGQSADRFERRREQQKQSFFEEVAAEADRSFLGEVDGLLLGGTTVTVEEFRASDELDHRLRDAIVGDPFPVEYATEQGLEQLATRAAEHLELGHQAEREALDQFYEALATGEDEEVVYGSDRVEEAFTYDAVETVLLSADLSAADLREYEERAEREGGECVVVSDAFERGEQFAEAFGGVAAFLRFPIE